MFRIRWGRYAKILTTSKEGISPGQSSPRELSDLDSIIVPLLLHEIYRFRHVPSDDGRSSSLNEVLSKNLGNEGEGSRCSEVTLDNLQLSLVLIWDHAPNNLHVVGARDLERSGNLLRNGLEALHVNLRQRERRENKGCVPGMDTSVLDVFRNGVDEKLALVSDGVDVDLLSIFDELGDNDGVERRNRSGGREVVIKSRFFVDDVHSGSRQDVGRSNENGITVRD